MRKHFLFTVLAGLLLSGSLMAETLSIRPIGDYNYRTNKNDPDGWTTVTLVDEQFEVANKSQFFAIQTWTIPNIDKVSSLKFVYPRVSGQTNTGGMDIWAFPYSSMVTDKTWSKAEGSFIDNVKTVLGVYPGNTISNTALHGSDWDDTNKERTITLGSSEIELLKTAGKTTNNHLTVNVLLTNSSEQNYKFYRYGENASYCIVTYSETPETPVFLNNRTKSSFSSLKDALEDVSAIAGDTIVQFQDYTFSGTRAETTKAMTIVGGTRNTTISTSADNTLLLLAKEGTSEYKFTFKNLTIDGLNTKRKTQILESKDNAALRFDGVKVINTKYSIVTGDVKNFGKSVYLVGNNSFATGIYLDNDKRIDHTDAKHTDPIKLILFYDYKQNYAIVLHCSDATKYNAIDASNGVDWSLAVSTSGENKELKGTRSAKSYSLTVTDAGMATLLLGFNAPIPSGVKAYKLTNEGTSDIYAKEVNSITRHEPVLVIANAGTYEFNGTETTTSNPAEYPESGCLRGTYSETGINVPSYEAGSYNYILTKVGEEVGFFHANSDGTNKVSKNHAYLFTTYNAIGGGSSAPMRLRFVTETATGIEDVVTAEKAEKLLIDGVIYIRKADHLYRIDGQLVK